MEILAEVADLFASRAQMKREAEEAREATDEGVVVAFVQADPLMVVRLGARSTDGNARHGGREELAVMPLRAVDRETQRDAASVREQTALGASFGAIRGVWAGFSPRPTEPWSSLRPPTASASRCPCTGRTRGGRVSRTHGRRRPPSTPESVGAPTTRSRSRSPAVHSRYSPSAARTGWPASPIDRAPVDDVRPWDAAAARAAAAPSAPTTHPGSASDLPASPAPRSHLSADGAPRLYLRHRSTGIGSKP